MINTPERRRAASGIVTILLGPGVTPGADSPSIRQQIGWGYSGLPNVTELPPTGYQNFVYRPIRRRLKARKRQFN